MSLRDWVNNGWLVEHSSSREEVADLLAIVDRDLRDCTIPRLSADWQLNIAYNAALQAATAALAAAGYRASREAHHYRVIQTLEFTIGAKRDLILLFDQYRKKRNIGGYERAGTTSDHEVNEMVELAKRLHRDVSAWIRAMHPDWL